MMPAVQAISKPNRTPPMRLQSAWLVQMALLVALLLLVASPNSYAAGNNALQQISHSLLPGNRVQIALQMAQTPNAPQGFTIDNPARITLDLLGTQSQLKSRTIPIDAGIVRSISTAETSDRTRVVINLTTLAPYKTHIEGTTLYLTLESSNEAQRIPRRASNSIPARIRQNSDLSTEINRPASSMRTINGIDFRRGEEGEGRVIITLSENGIPMDVNKQGGKVVVDFLSTSVAQQQVRRLDVLDFATPVKSIDVLNQGNNARIIITPTSQEFEQLAYQSDNIFTIELKPIGKTELEKKIKEKFGYTGKRLSLNFQDIEVRSVLQLLADFTELNIVVSDTVTGRLTLRLKNVPWDQALDIILKSKGLGMRKNGNVLLVAPNEEIAAREKLELEALQQVEELAPLKTEFIQINYAKAAEIAEMLKSENSTILSARGNVTIDPRTNTLLIHDTQDKLTEIRDLVVRLDVPVRQVLIESRIVIASDDFSKELGVRFGVSGRSGSSTTNVISPTVNSADEVMVGSTPTLDANRYNVNLAATNPMGSIALALAKLPMGTLLELELSAMQAEGQGEVISSPRIVTSNQKEATIKQGMEIPYESTSSNGTQVQFKEAKLILKVTPQITPDDRIIMDLFVTKNNVGSNVNSNITVPSIDTREVQTQVLVDNGETIVLGGVYEQTNLNIVSRVPFFSDLPLIGGLFKNNQIQNAKRELLVFVTPKIVTESAGIDY